MIKVSKHVQYIQDTDLQSLQAFLHLHDNPHLSQWHLKLLCLQSLYLFLVHSYVTVNHFSGMIISAKMSLTLLHSERPKLHTILAFLSAIGLKGLHSGIQINTNKLTFRCSNCISFSFASVLNRYSKRKELEQILPFKSKIPS